MRNWDMAARRPRFGYQRIHVMLRREGWPVNKKRVRRLYRLEGLQLRTRIPPPQAHVPASRGGSSGEAYARALEHEFSMVRSA